MAAPEIVGPRLVGLCGPAGSGKSTAAAILAEWGYTRLRFAAPLKAALRAMLAEAGVTEAEAARMIEGDLKEAPHAALAGRTPRHAMQTLGTEWGRALIHPDLWVRLTMCRAEAILAAGGRVVIEDVRFPNEAAAVQGVEVDHMRGVRELWAMAGRGGIPSDHESEAQPLLADMVLHNSDSLEALEATILAEILG